MDLKADRFDVLEFYSYPTVVIHEINSYTELFDKGTGEKKVKRFFDGILQIAEAKLNRRLFDNKIAFKIRHRPTGTILYVGYKDNIWRIGLDVGTVKGNSQMIK